MRAICKLLGGIKLLALLIICSTALVLLVPMLFGCRPYAVISGSMEPAIPKGSVVFASKADTIQLGDVVTYRLGASDMVVTHRVVGIDGDALTTKGDANNAADPSPISRRTVIGVVKCSIPLLGLMLGEKSRWIMLALVAVYTGCGTILKMCCQDRDRERGQMR